MSFKRWAITSFVAGIALATHGSAIFAQDFPTRAVRIVVPFAAGGSIDTVARLISPGMAATLGQPVVVENRPGGGSMLAADLIAKSAPDGYTVLLTSNSLAAAPSLYRKLSFDAAKDFAAVTQLVDSDSAVVVSRKLSVASMKDLIALAKSKPGKLNYGNTGIGGPSHLTMELLKILAGIDLVAIPYKGMAPLEAALISGEVDVAVATVASAQAHIRAGRIRLLAITSGKRSAAFPEIPTVAESGFPGFEASGWNSLFVAANTPARIVEQLQVAAVKALNRPEVRERLPGLGLEPVGSTPAQFDRKFRADLAQFERIVREARIPIQD
jgi:tripartite-type tricarboxylate transporter receptor subunit TctC